MLEMNEQYRRYHPKLHEQWNKTVDALSLTSMEWYHEYYWEGQRA